MTDRSVIVGGGTGGSVLSDDLADRLKPELEAGNVQITLINDGPEQVYKPVWLYVQLGRREPADGRRHLDTLADGTIDIQIDRVTDIDMDSRRLRFADGSSTEYDYLALATGSTIEPEQLPGLVEGEHDHYSDSGAINLREQLLSLTQKELVLSVIDTPHMCPAAPVKQLRGGQNEQTLRDLIAQYHD